MGGFVCTLLPLQWVQSNNQCPFWHQSLLQDYLTNNQFIGTFQKNISISKLPAPWLQIADLKGYQEIKKRKPLLWKGCTVRLSYVIQKSESRICLVTTADVQPYHWPASWGKRLLLPDINFPFVNLSYSLVALWKIDCIYAIVIWRLSLVSLGTRGR